MAVLDIKKKLAPLVKKLGEDTPLFTALVALDIVTIGLACVLMSWLTTDLVAGVGVAAALVTIAVALIPAVKNKQADWSAWILLAIPLGVLPLVLIGGATYLYTENRDIDVLGSVRPARIEPMKNGDHGTFEVGTDNQPRSTLAVIVRLAQYRSTDPVCVPGSLVKLAPMEGLRHNGPLDVRPGNVVELELAGAPDMVRFQATLVAESGCRLTLDLAEARLTR